MGWIVDSTRHSSIPIKVGNARACRSLTHQFVSIFARPYSAVQVFVRKTELRPDDYQISEGLELVADTASKTTGKTDTKAPPDRCCYDRDEYIHWFTDWTVGQGLSGEFDRETIEYFAQQFDRYARTNPMKSDSLFKGLKAIGIVGRLVDLSSSDPRYLAAKRRGIVRPRVRIYCLPDEVPEFKASPSSRDRSMAA